MKVGKDTFVEFTRSKNMLAHNYNFHMESYYAELKIHMVP